MLPSNASDLLAPPLAFLFTGVIAATWKILLWLFPYFPYQEDRQNSLRKSITGTFAVIALALVASVLYDSFKGLVSQGSTQTLVTTIITTSTTTLTIGAPIPGFPGESIFIGLVVGLSLVLLAKTRARKRRAGLT
jgi:hypothetical protein